jgi:GMP synthase-like glutamine amidotransferase
LPSEAILLASSQRVANQALKLQDRPVYATQFHPELRLEAYLARLEAYPRYVTQISGLSSEAFVAQCVQTPESNKLLGQFLREVVAAS